MDFPFLAQDMTYLPGRDVVRLLLAIQAAELAAPRTVMKGMHPLGQRLRPYPVMMRFQSIKHFADIGYDEYPDIRLSNGKGRGLNRITRFLSDTTSISNREQRSAAVYLPVIDTGRDCRETV